MDKRRTQRILGILVIIALVIILFPLLFSKNEVATQTASVTPPTFPAQQKAPATTAINNSLEQPSNTVETATEPLQANPASAAKQDTIIPDAPALDMDSAANAVTTETPVAPQADSPTPIAAENTTQTPAPIATENTAQTAPIAIENTAQPAPIAAGNSAQEESITASPENNDTNALDQAKNREDLKKPSTPLEVASTSEAINKKVVKKPVEKIYEIKTSKAKKPAHKQASHHEVAKLNKPAWIVQMGSFKSKENARGLTDKLRAAGYNAFTKDIKSAKGNHRIHVYIGPEFKEAEATKISQKLQHDLNLPSIVLPYKPLAL